MIDKDTYIIRHKDYKPERVTYGFVGKKFPLNVNRYRNISDAEQNKNAVLHAFGYEKGHLSILHQVHSADAVIVNDISDEELKGDAQVTSNKNILLGIQTADCVPIMFIDEVNRVVGAAHSGWRGAINNVIDSTIQRMIRLGANESRIVAVIGPCIQQDSYEVGAEFLEEFMSESRDNGKFFRDSINRGKFMFDLPSYVKSKLGRHDLSAVFDVEMDTYSNEKMFFSYRRSCHRNKKLDGMVLSVVGLS